jgi:hypothetical protein
MAKKKNKKIAKAGKKRKTNTNYQQQPKRLVLCNLQIYGFHCM